MTLIRAATSLIAALTAAAVLTACTIPTPTPAQSRESPTATAPQPREQVPEPSPTPAPTHRPSATPADPPTPEPTRDPALWSTPRPDDYARGHTPLNITDNQTFLQSLPPQEASCLTETITPDMTPHIVDLATSPGHGEQERLWNCLSQTTLTRMVVAKISQPTGSTGPETQACLAQTLQGADPALLWRAIHMTDQQPGQEDLAANLAYVAASCFAGQETPHPGSIAGLPLSMATRMECLRAHLGNPHNSVAAIQTGNGLTPGPAIDLAWQECRNPG